MLQMRHPLVTRLLFGILAMLLPLLVLVPAELLLRLSGVAAERQELFRPVPQDERYVALNPRFAGRYFAGFEPDVAPQPFLARKAGGTLRLFVLGGSTAAGFPYNHYYGFPVRLQEMLQLEQPGRPVEVINLAMTAVNSFTLRDIHRELLRYDPDGILIYAGHNEYYGAFGAASVSGWMRPLAVRRLVLQLERLHLVAAGRQVLSGLIGRASGKTGTTEPRGGGMRSPGDRTLMARMAEDRLVPLDGPVYRAGIRHFEKNMEDVLATFRRHAIPVYLATVVSNKTGQVPLSNDPEAMDLFGRSQFSAAKERDPLRFRAPEAINQSLRRLSDQPGVIRVDISEVQTPEGDLLAYAAGYFTDHLHPDYRGYTLIARAFYAALTAQELTQGGDFPPPDPLETILVAHTLAVLKSDFPFERDPQRRRPGVVHRERLNRYKASGDPVMLAARDYFTGARPLASSLASLAGSSRQEGRHTDALLYLRSLVRLQPLNPELDAMILRYLQELSRQDGVVAPAELLPLYVWLAAPRFNVQTWPVAVERLVDAGRFDAADLWLQAWQQYESDPRAEFFRLRALWHIGQGDYQGAQPWFREYYRRIR